MIQQISKLRVANFDGAFGTCFIALALASTLFLQGCSMAQGLVSFLTPTGGSVELRKISLSADRQVNDGSPVAVDVVIVRDKKAYETIAHLRASEWFNAKHDFLRQYQQRLIVHSWEIVPGQTLGPTPLPAAGSGVVGTLVFANFTGDKTFRADATGMSAIRLQLSKRDFLVKAL